jgi:hypothetical protein
MATPVDYEKFAGEYNWEDAKAKLRAIGEAIQSYRLAKHLKQESDWKTREDTGMPPSLVTLLVDQEAVPREALFVRSRQPTPYRSSFTFVGDAIERVFDANELEKLWSKRGDRLPIVLDTNMYSNAEILKSTKPLRVLVLRLSGEVDETLFQSQNFRDLYLNR